MILFLVYSPARAFNYGSGSYGNSFYSSYPSDIHDIVVVPSSNSAQISFSTSELTSASINYGLTTNYSTSTPETDLSPLTLGHSISLNNLSACTTYHYNIKVRDVYLNEITNSDSVFTTTGCTASSDVSAVNTVQVDNLIGGTLILKDSNFYGLALTVPTSFASSSANFQAHRLNGATVLGTISGPSNIEPVGDYFYELKALSGLSDAISNFTSPLLVSISYSASDVEGIDESSLRIYRWDGSTWTQLNNCSVDTNTKTVTCETYHFSTFSLFGDYISNNSPLIITPCSSVAYDFWQESCVNGKQFRNILSQNPNSCSLTVEQRALTERVCGESIIQANNEDPTLDNKIERVYNDEKSALAKVIDKKLSARLAGYILLQVETHGRAWYLDPASLNRYYLADGSSAYQALRRFGLGITNQDLNKIPVAPTSVLPSDYSKSSVYSRTLTNKLKGKILLQVENRGEAWYVNPRDGYRYYLANGEAAYQIMKQLSLGISNKNIWQISVGDFK